MEFQYANGTADGLQHSEITPSTTFNITAKALTDIWRKPPNLDVFTAPIIYKSIPVASFKRARLTAQAKWQTLFDQGGIVIVLPPKKSVVSISASSSQKRWVKAGIEFYGGRPMMSVVAADAWADWSLLPLSAASEAKGQVTVEIEREVEADGEKGTVLKVLLVDEDGVKTIIREVTWAFWEVDESAEMWVGAFAAKPTVDDIEVLEVTFDDFVIESSE
jgi:regulation of enolase protein 1 (concanavalin A-like superfamily)